MKKFNHIEIEYINTEATCGACLKDCLIEAVELSMKEGINVFVKHNGHSFKIDFEEIINKVRHPN